MGRTNQRKATPKLFIICRGPTLPSCRLVHKSKMAVVNPDQSSLFFGTFVTHLCTKSTHFNEYFYLAIKI